MNTLSQLKPKLNRLKMSGILENLDLRIRQAEEERLAYSDFLLSLFQDEIERRDFKVLSARLKKSGLEAKMTFESFDFRFNARIHEPAIRELCTCSFVERMENVFLVGPSGVGKTHIAMALGHEAVRRGIDVLFRRTYALLKWLGSGRADGTFERKLKSIADVPLLILDDFGLNDRKRQIRPIFTGGSNCAMLSLKRRLAWNRTRKSTTQNSGLSISGNGKRAAYPGGDTAPERIYPIGPFCIG